MKSPGRSTRTASASWADRTLGPGPLPEPRPRTRVFKTLLAILSLGFFVLGTAEPVHDGPAHLQRLEQSPSGGLCPAGYHLSEENGLCKPCSDGVDYTRSPNRLPSCIPCRVCKEDKVVKSQCTLTRNTECQCKPGTFEDKDSTEICQSCSNCTDEEDEVTPCTPETNRRCVSKNAWASQHNLGLVIGLPVASMILLIGALAVWKINAWWPGCLLMIRNSGCERDPESANTLLGPKTSSKTNDSHHNTEPQKTQSLPTGRKPLVPANGTDPTAALKYIFEYCPKVVPFNSWDALMRQMGLTDNEIHVVRAETPGSHDVLYQMLQKWHDKTGRSASINHLLDALEVIGERCALEKIEDYAVESGKFIYQNTTAHVGTPESEPGGSL
ncbi:tumor necrosis factor receptor superfamily member 10B-like isoform X2 [Apodemus sylvaticus]|uniref:tumor necrosis factor receptor superfamily member 10B-like isoform X2 n=1 Tax=Apodemus sylvaticus TaxID=10129 RepID=UPI0022442100|nr:tumor necrosis factor receptor superfamily member 10B-like isoform X2 [Apodemus sylvaticus]